MDAHPPNLTSDLGISSEREQVEAFACDSSALAAQMEAGRHLKLELTDLNASSVAVILPLEQFANVHKAQPAQTFDFTSDEE